MMVGLPRSRSLFGEQRRYARRVKVRGEAGIDGIDLDVILAQCDEHYGGRPRRSRPARTTSSAPLSTQSTPPFGVQQVDLISLCAAHQAEWPEYATATKRSASGIHTWLTMAETSSGTSQTWSRQAGMSYVALHVRFASAEPQFTVL
jgi:hypothetical protein